MNHKDAKDAKEGKNYRSLAVVACGNLCQSFRLVQDRRSETELIECSRAMDLAALDPSYDAAAPAVSFFFRVLRVLAVQSTVPGCTVAESQVASRLEKPRPRPDLSWLHDAVLLYTDEL